MIGEIITWAAGVFFALGAVLSSTCMTHYSLGLERKCGDLFGIHAQKGRQSGLMRESYARLPSQNVA